jgi:uncharacterized protein YkwD
MRWQAAEHQSPAQAKRFLGEKQMFKRILRAALVVALLAAFAAPAARAEEGFGLPVPLTQVIGLLTPYSQLCPGAGAVPTQATIASAAKATLCLLNHERARHHLAPLASNRALARAALAHSQDMVARRYFAHVDLSGGDPIKRILRTRYVDNTVPWWLGENIAWGTQQLATPAMIFAEWMHSPPHVANILSKRYRRIGIGIVAGAPADNVGPGAATYTTDFGSANFSGTLAQARRAAAARRHK